MSAARLWTSTTRAPSRSPRSSPWVCPLDPPWRQCFGCAMVRPTTPAAAAGGSTQTSAPQGTLLPRSPGWALSWERHSRFWVVLLQALTLRMWESLSYALKSAFLLVSWGQRLRRRILQGSRRQCVTNEVRACHAWLIARKIGSARQRWARRLRGSRTTEPKAQIGSLETGSEPYGWVSRTPTKALSTESTTERLAKQMASRSRLRRYIPCVCQVSSSKIFGWDRIGQNVV